MHAQASIYVKDETKKKVNTCPQGRLPAALPLKYTVPSPHSLTFPEAGKSGWEVSA